MQQPEGDTPPTQTEKAKSAARLMFTAAWVAALFAVVNAVLGRWWWSSAFAMLWLVWLATGRYIRRHGMPAKFEEPR
ncbi:MAG: hypothetical protein JWO05_2659 [Gemmatimonadetes bacterium]|nr:hypothetical protein [Gemmatimonadota bacterium]